MCIFYYKYIFLIKINIIFIFPKFPGNFLKNLKKILYIYYLIQKYIIETILTDITTKKIVNNDKSKFQNISYLLHVKLPISSC